DSSSSDEDSDEWSDGESTFVHDEVEGLNNTAGHKCNECGKTFTTRKSLKIHTRSHLTDDSARRPYECDECQNRFTTSGGLRGHKRRHLRELEYTRQRFRVS
ncbi:hypothetical protein PMAYCL1PPCAC_27719, partial [Pristionchus mayeri]